LSVLLHETEEDLFRGYRRTARAYEAPRRFSAFGVPRPEDSRVETLSKNRFRGSVSESLFNLGLIEFYYSLGIEAKGSNVRVEV
jgi:hypothetical protein